MKLYELVNPSDCITFYAEGNDIAEAVSLLIGKGKTGITAIDGSETPSTMYFFGPVPEDVLNRFKEISENRIDEVIAACKTSACCSGGEREIYDDYTDNGINIEKRDKWHEKNCSSMSDFCAYAWSLKVKG